MTTRCSRKVSKPLMVPEVWRLTCKLRPGRVGREYADASDLASFFADEITTVPLLFSLVDDSGCFSLDQASRTLVCEAGGYTSTCRPPFNTYVLIPPC